MNPHINIELAKLSQASAIGRMSMELIEHGLNWRWKPQKVRTMILAPEVTVICAMYRSEMAGFAMMEFSEESAHLNLLAVRPGARRVGLGSDLVNWLMESARVAGIARIILEVRSENRVAREFYDHLGFEVTDFVKGYYDGREHALKMMLQLMDPVLNSRRPRGG